MVTCRAYLVSIVLLTAALAMDEYPPPVYSVNLDEPEERRWDTVCRDYSVSIRKTYTEIELLLLNMGFATFIAKAGQALPDLPFAGEVSALAACANVNTSVAAAANLLYFLAATETAQPSGLGVVASRLHGANFGVGGIAPLSLLLKKSIIVVSFKRGSEKKELFRAVVPAGFAYPWVGIRPGAYSVQANPRHRGTDTDNIEALNPYKVPPSSLVRITLTECSSYTSALSLLSSHLVCTPVFFVIAGAVAGEGAVVERNATDLGNGSVWLQETLHEEDGVLNPGGWYAVATNDDLSQAQRFGDQRRATAVNILLASGKEGVTTDVIRTILTRTQLTNTVYHSVMTPSTGAMEVVVLEDHPFPSPPPSPPPPSSNSGLDRGQVIFFLLILFGSVFLAGIVFHFTGISYRKKVAEIKRMLSRAESKKYSTFFEGTSTGLNQQEPMVDALQTGSAARPAVI